MKIILLTGRPNTGKTTTLNMVYNQLTQGMTNPPHKQIIQGGSANDFECVFQNNNTINNKTVAIFSMGDILYMIYDAIIRYMNNSDVLIVAHSQGGYIKDKLIQTITNNNPPHCVIKKTANNANDCQNIINNI